MLVEEAETSTDQREDDWHPHCSTEIKYRIRRCHDTEEKGLFVPIESSRLARLAGSLKVRALEVEPSWTTTGCQTRNF